jgi:glycosyltransferase involved in cell wall biosynthesis
MRALFVLPYRHPRPGGAQWTTHWLARELARRGHVPAVLAAEGGDRVDEGLGYPVLTAPGAADEFRPDVVVVTAHHDDDDGPAWTGAAVAAAAPLPVVLYVHDAGARAGSLAGGRGASAIAAVSAFVADVLGDAGVEAEVVPPIVDRAHYRTATTREVALFMTPIAYKGLATALMLARARPDVRFAFVAGGRMTEGELSALRDETDGLANVEIRAASRDPAAIYGDARVVLVPSVHPEAWGRVVTEAQASGIPAIASAAGGLPESVGAGGLLVGPEAGDEGWRAALAELWDDGEAYERHAAAAERQGHRADVTPRAVGDRFERLLLDVLAVRR